MIQVTKDQFYATVGQLNAHPHIVTSYPYTAEWRIQDQVGYPMVGKTVDRYVNESKWPVETDYYVVESLVK